MSKAKKAESVVKPLIKVAGADEHPIKKIYEGNPESLPEVKSIGYMRISPTSNKWVSYVIITKGNQVLSFEVSEPDLRAIAEDNSKVDFVKHFMDQE